MLGGEDFDEQLLDHLVAAFKAQQVRSDPAAILVRRGNFNPPRQS